jgi:hypothetical protein
MIVAFDPSITHLGWALFDENQTGKGAVLEAGVFQTAPTDGLLIHRLILQRTRVRLFLELKKINFVVMEAPILSDFNTEKLFALNQFLHEVFLDLGVFVLYIQSATWKKMMFPDMNPIDVTKHHSSHLAKTELDRHGKRFSEHVADAYHLGKIGHRFYQWNMMKILKDTDLTPAEVDLFCGKHTFVKGIKKGITEYYGLIYRENDQFFDFAKQPWKSHLITKSIIEEIENGSGKTGKEGQKGYFNACRIL